MTTITCNQLDDLLFDASPLAMETAARHAESCAECAEKLAAWNEIEETARSMRETWQSDLLWPRIGRALKHELEGALANSRQRSPRAKWLWQIAAGFLLTVGLGGTVFYAVRVQSHDAAFDRDILRLAAMDEVERAEQSHLEAIERLERVAEQKLDDAQTPLMVSYKEKLMLLDEAIAECQANIDRNRQNAHLRKQLLAMYTDKQQTLTDVVREDNDVSNP
jgi:predicted transcriptional regulator